MRCAASNYAANILLSTTLPLIAMLSLVMTAHRITFLCGR
jgi:hypothetical protein